MAQPNTETLTITIKNAGGQYTIEAEGAEGIWADPQPFPVRRDLLSETQEATLMEMAEDDSKAEPEAIQQLGRTLFQAIFSQPSILRAFSKVEGRAQLQSHRIRLCLKIEPPELVALPWEAMHDGTDWFLMRKNIALVRQLPQRIEFSPNFQVTGPLKILFIGGVSPRALPNLDRNIERLAEDLSESLAKDIEVQRVVFKVILKASLKDLQTELPQDYHIVCFAGHGEPDGIYLRAEYDEYVRLSAKDLAEKGLLARDSVRVVFLAACKTAVAAQETQESFAQTLIKEASLPAVVAMQSYVSIGKAAPLVRQFFTSLSAGQPVDVALSEARRTILSREGVVRDVVAPVMYLQTERPRVFDIAPISPGDQVAMPSVSPLSSLPDKAVPWYARQSNSWIRIGVPLGIGLLVIVGVILLVWRGLPPWSSLPATCKSALPTRLQAGGYAYVSLDPPNPNTLRSGAGSGYAEIAKIQVGEPVEILEGPKCVRDMLFWKVRVIGINKTGWTAEIGQENGHYTYWLEPCPSESECYNAVGHAYYQDDDYSNALAALTRAIELDPTPEFGHPYYLLGEIYFNEGKYSDAISAFTRELELKGASDAYYWRGKSYQALDRIQEARADYEYISDADSRAKTALDELNAAISIIPTLTEMPICISARDKTECEPNDNFDLANRIGAGVSYTANFVPWDGAKVDFDYFEIKILSEIPVVCEGKALDSGVDPQTEFYTKSDQDYIPQLGEYRADVDLDSQNLYSWRSYIPHYKGLLYIRVSQGDDDLKPIEGRYTLKCSYTELDLYSTPDPKRIHIVQSGDSLYTIARRYGVSVDQLKMANELYKDKIEVGQQLIIP